MLSRLIKPTAAAKVSLNFKAKTWCALVALITALAFISLVSAAVTHYHNTTQESQDCSICSVVSHKVGGGFSAPAVQFAQFFMLFVLAVVSTYSSFYSRTKLLPPSCGPPVSTSVNLK